MSNRKNTSNRKDAGAPANITQDVIRSALDTTVYSVRCRCDFNPNISVKENKNNLRADVEENLSKLGLSIDRKVVTLQHVKALKSKDDPNVFQFILVALKISDENVVRQMENGPFAAGSIAPGNKTGGFTVQWPGREKGIKSTNHRSQPEPSKSVKRSVIKSKSSGTVAVEQKQESSGGHYILLTIATAAVVGASAYWMMKKHKLY